MNRGATGVRRAGAFRVAAGLALMAAAVASASASPGVWTSHGPAGASVYCLTADPSRPTTLYAGTGKGVFKSDDGGTSWRASASGMPATRVQTIAIDPTSPATLYAGTLTPNGVDSVGIFKSVDGAETWTAINTGLIDPLTGVTPLDVEALAVDPRHPGTVLAGTRFSEIFKSTDGGATWTSKTLGGFNVALETSAFLLDSSSANVLAASTQGLVRSTDGGETWALYGNAGVSFFSLAADPTSAATLYAGNISGFGILKSTDGGAHWISVNQGLPVNQDAAGSFSPLALVLAVDPSHPSTVYAGTYGNGLFRSTDGAASWTLANAGMRDGYVAALVLPSGPSKTFSAGTLGGGVYQSTDGTSTWFPSSTGFDQSIVAALVADPGAPSAIYAATFDGVRRSVDAGNSWQSADSGLPVAPVSALVVAPGSPGTFFVGTLGGGVLKSSDGAASWTASAQGLSDSYISSLAVDPTSPSTLYAGTAHPDTSKSERVFKSVDAGATWTQTSLDAKSSTVDFLAVNPAKPAQVLAASHGVSGLFQSLDGGKTWSTLSTDSSCGGINTIFFDSAGSTIFLGDTTGVCRSTDGGKTWTASSVAILASVQALIVDPGNPSTLYAGASPAVATGTGGVFRSDDGGQTWVPVGTGLESASVTSLVFDGAGRLHAGLHGGGVAELVLPAERPPIAHASATRRARKIAPR